MDTLEHPHLLALGFCTVLIPLPKALLPDHSCSSSRFQCRCPIFQEALPDS